MSKNDHLDELELAGQLCSKVCHDVISPIGAIINGLEVLDDYTDEEMRSFAMDLIRKSAARASASVLFARLAFGAVGSAGLELSLAEIYDVAAGFIVSDKVTLDWKAPLGSVTKDVGRLILNVTLLTHNMIPRGGAIAVIIREPLDKLNILFEARGAAARIPEEYAALISGDVTLSDIDARSIQPYFTGLLARNVGAELSFLPSEECVVTQMRVVS